MFNRAKTAQEKKAANEFKADSLAKINRNVQVVQADDVYAAGLALYELYFGSNPCPH